MTAGHIANDLHLSGETVVTPRSALVVGAGIVVPARCNLDGAYQPAQLAFARAVQDYADRLAAESANQAISERAPGVSSNEITESAVIRAKESLDKRIVQQLARRKSKMDLGIFSMNPVLSGATGIMGGFLHSTLQWAGFIPLAICAISCAVYTVLKGVQ